MSKEFDQIIKEINKQHKELNSIDQQITKEVIKDIYDIKKSIKNIDNKLILMENVLNQLFELINNITIFIDEEDTTSEQDNGSENWNSYQDESYTEEDDYWSSHEDES